jgi:hypothetical protein
MKSVLSDWQLPEPRHARHPYWCDPGHCTVRTDLMGANGLRLEEWGQHRTLLIEDTRLKSAGLTLTVGKQAVATEEASPTKIWLRLSSLERSMDLAMSPRDAYRFATALLEAMQIQAEPA